MATKTDITLNAEQEKQYDSLTKLSEEQDHITQKICKRCGGVKSMKLRGVNLPYEQWMHYGFACDVGCIC